MIASTTFIIQDRVFSGLSSNSNNSSNGNKTKEDNTYEEIFAEKEKQIQKSLEKHQNGSKYYGAKMMLESTSVSYAGYWAFNEPSGSINFDFSDYTNNGAITNAVRVTSGIYGPCMSFNGNGDYVDCGTSPTLAAGEDSITVEAWVKPNTISGTDRIVTKKWQYYLFLEGGYLAFHISGLDPVTTVYSTSRLAAGTWYHVAGTWDGSMLTVWINGTESNTDLVSGMMNDYAYACYIGQSEGENKYFDGYIDEVRIGNDALSSTVLAKHAINKPENAILMNYTYEENSNFADDLSEFDKDGTFNGDTEDVINSNGYCVHLDGTGDYISGSNAYCLRPQEFTLTAWIYPLSADDHDNIISRAYNTGGQPYYSYGLKINSNGKIVILNAAGGSNHELLSCIFQ